MKNLRYSLTKIFVFLSVVFGFMALPACNGDENEIEITVDISHLPDVALQLIEDYFGGKDNIAKIIEKEINSIKLYKVTLEDGIIIDFNDSGIWQQIDAPDGMTIPFSILPEPIQATLNYSYHGFGVTELNRDGENYHLVLSNNQGGDSLDLTFNQSGEIIDTGEMD